MAMTILKQLEEALTAQQQAEEELEMIMEQLDSGHPITDGLIEEHEEREAAANKAMVEAAIAHMPGDAAAALKTVQETQPKEAIRIAVGYAEATTGILFLSHA